MLTGKKEIGGRFDSPSCCEPYIEKYKSKLHDSKKKTYLRDQEIPFLVKYTEFNALFALKMRLKWCTLYV